MQRLQKSPPSSSLRTALEAYEDAGGVLDYVVFDVASPVVSSDHEEAAWLAMDEIGLKVEQTTNAFPILMDRRPGSPSTITARELVGPFYDWEREALIVPHLSVLPTPKGDGTTHGYADAFWDPPYKLTCKLDEATLLFRTINHELFGGLSDELDVRSWPTDWSNYFAAGLEWWGAFYWTVYSPRTRKLVVIGGSTTD